MFDLRPVCAHCSNFLGTDAAGTAVKHAPVDAAAHAAFAAPIVAIAPEAR